MTHKVEKPTIDWKETSMFLTEAGLFVMVGVFIVLQRPFLSLALWITGVFMAKTTGDYMIQKALKENQK